LLVAISTKLRVLKIGLRYTILSLGIQLIAK